MFFDWKAAAVNVKGTKKLKWKEDLIIYKGHQNERKENEARIKRWNVSDFKEAK